MNAASQRSAAGPWSQMSQKSQGALFTLSADERADCEERAAILEYDEGLDRVEAERRALARVLSARL